MSVIVSEAEAVLREAGIPLHYRDLTKRILARGRWQTSGLTPDQTVNARLTTHMRQHGAQSLFRRVGKGVYALGIQSDPLPEQIDTAVPTALDTPSHPQATRSTVTFLDAAEQILRQHGIGKPVHYRDIANRVVQSGMVKTEGRTPEATLYSQLITDINRAERQGKTPRFERVGRGLFALAGGRESGLNRDIERHNDRVRGELKRRLLEMSPYEFEALIGQLLVKLGFEEVEVTDRSGDGGIDVRGTLVVGDVIRTNMAVQVKRWRANIQAPTVQQVRGSLGTHDQGLIITTSDFSRGARDEAARPNATPVALMSGDQLVALLVEHDIGVQRRSTYLLDLDAPGTEPA